MTDRDHGKRVKKLTSLWLLSNVVITNGREPTVGIGKKIAKAAGQAIADGARKAVAPKVVASTSEEYCNDCRRMATTCRCRKPCCVNLRHGQTEGGTHHKG